MSALLQTIKAKGIHLTDRSEWPERFAAVRTNPSLVTDQASRSELLEELLQVLAENYGFDEHTEVKVKEFDWGTQLSIGITYRLPPAVHEQMAELKAEAQRLSREIAEARQSETVALWLMVAAVLGGGIAFALWLALA